MAIPEALILTVILGVVITLLAWLVHWSAAKVTEDTERMIAARDALKRHHQAMATIMGQSDRIDPFLARYLLDFCERVPDRKAACQIMDLIESGEVPVLSEAARRRSQQFHSAMTQLRKEDEALWSEVSTAISSGLFATLFQWPDVRARLSLLERWAENMTAANPEVAVVVREHALA